MPGWINAMAERVVWYKVNADGQRVGGYSPCHYTDAMGIRTLCFKKVPKPSKNTKFDARVNAEICDECRRFCHSLNIPEQPIPVPRRVNPNPNSPTGAIRARPARDASWFANVTPAPVASYIPPSPSGEENDFGDDEA
mgnify:CR=1 FL=1